MENPDVRQAVPVAVRQAESFFDELKARVVPHFATAQVAEHMAEYVRGLLAHIERKNCWQLAEEAGLKAPYDFQYLLGRALWDADAVRDELQLYVGQILGWRGGTLILDETGFLKKGDRSAGVARMYSGTAGRIENCQIGVFLGYRTAQGHALVDRELYLPEDWTEDRERCTKAGIPEERGLLTKPELARRMLERAYVAGFRPDWVTGDEVYGASGDLRRDLEKRGQAYVLAVGANVCVNELGHVRRVDQVVSGLNAGAFETHSYGLGSKGPRVCQWTRIGLMRSVSGRLARWLLVRRNPRTGELAYYFVAAGADTTLAEMAQAAGNRWPIEECFEAYKGEVGLDEYEVRSWSGWYRHMTLALMAGAFLTKLRVEAHQEGAPQVPKVRRSSLRAFRSRQRRACASASRNFGGC